jgi:hypothetical protein
MSIFCNEETRIKRYNVCKECEHFRAITKQCKLCSCFMPVKTKMLAMTCPLNKWDNPYTTNWKEI